MTTRRALITGASRGLGFTLADFLAKQGFELVLTARGARELETKAAELARHTRVISIPGDIGDERHQDDLRRATEGGLNLLVNNASTLGPTPLPTLAAYPLAQLRQVYETNLFAPLALIQVTLPALQTSQGLVINISSDAALGGYPGWGAYGSSKSALDLISKTLAAEQPEITIVSVDPGDMRTRMHQEAFPGEDISDRPLPETTLPFWAWLLGQPRESISGRRFQAQADTWEIAEAEIAKGEIAEERVAEGWAPI
jgi:NAD(P)-dependent dehydrogenase (short-subunit alcohol dehydrogenase family)